MAATLRFAFRLLDPRTGAVLAEATVHATTEHDAEKKGRRQFSACRWRQCFWELETYPPRAP